MRTKELARQVRDKVVEKYKAGFGSKKYSKLWPSHGALLNPSSENGKSTAQPQTYQVKAIHLNWQAGQGEH